MSSTKIPPPRKLTDSEDIDSFDDWWFQVECYYSRDENFREFFSPDSSWQSKSTTNRGLSSAQKALHLNCLLRAIATYSCGPYIKSNITDKATSLTEVKNEFLKYLQIDVNDYTAMSWFEIQRKPTERPLVFYYRLRYHVTKHLVKRNTLINGTALSADEKVSPTLDRFIVLEWLNRLDARLVNFIKEKFSTELSAGSNVLVSMVETLAKNIDSYITTLNGSGSVGAVAYSNPSPLNDSITQQEEGTVGTFQQSFTRGRSQNLNFRRSNYGRSRGVQPRRNYQQRGRVSNQGYKTRNCEYCFIQSKSRDIDFRHPISECPEMSAMHGSIQNIEGDFIEEENEFESSALEFLENDD